MDKQETNINTNDKLEFVSCVISNEEGNVLVGKRLSTLSLDPGKLDLCSGHMKEGETPTQSMYRELREELGITIEDIKYLERIADIRTPHKKLSKTECHIFSAEVKLTEKELNERLKKVETPEFEKVRFLDNINELRTVQKYTEYMRTCYTDELDEALKKVMQRMYERKEIIRCEEK